MELASIRDEPQYLEWTQPLFSLVEKCESAKLNKYIIARCRAAVLASGASSGATGAAHPGYTKMENSHLPIPRIFVPEKGSLKKKNSVYQKKFIENGNYLKKKQFEKFMLRKVVKCSFFISSLIFVFVLLKLVVDIAVPDWMSLFWKLHDFFSFFLLC